MRVLVLVLVRARRGALWGTRRGRGGLAAIWCWNSITARGTRESQMTHHTTHGASRRWAGLGNSGFSCRKLCCEAKLPKLQAACGEGSTPPAAAAALRPRSLASQHTRRGKDSIEQKLHPVGRCMYGVGILPTPAAAWIRGRQPCSAEVVPYGTRGAKRAHRSIRPCDDGALAQARGGRDRDPAAPERDQRGL